MVSRTRLRTIVSTLCLYLGAAAMIGYFGFHAYHGNYGIHAKQDLSVQLKELTAELGQLRADREQWARRVALLRSGSIDPDMLDERARLMLDYGHPRDLTLRLD